MILLTVLCAAALRPVAAVAAPSDQRLAAGACTDGTGVTVIVDFQELGGGSYIRCAPNAPSSGFAALAQAGISYQTAIRSPGFLCKIAGKPSTDPCQNPSPPDATWAYWVAPRGGSWCYSKFGAGSRTPPQGTVEGWSFSLNKTASATPPPRTAPPAPVPGVAPSSLPARDCGAPTSGATSTTAPPATAPPTSPPRPGPSNPGAARPGTTGAPSGGTATPGRTGANGADGTTTTAGRGATTSTSAASKGPGEAATGDPSGGTPEEAGRSEAAGAEIDPTALGTNDGPVDLGSDGQGSGSPVALVIGVGLVAGLAACAAWLSRRNRPSPS